MNFKARLAIATASAAVILSTVAPATFANTNVTVSGNGALSKNNVTVNNTNSTNIVQSNSSTVITQVKSVANTGNNTVGFNVGGSTVISTGNAKSTVNVAVGGSTNNATINTNCGCSTNTTVDVKHNGPLSSNTVKVTNSNSQNIMQQAWDYVVTAVDSHAGTGNNNSIFNVKGQNGIVTGNSTSSVTVNVTGPANTAN